jgi:N-acetylglutamate synthase-like GNAT family acetyltransferase
MIEIVRLKPEEFPGLQFVHDGFVPDPKKSIAVIARNESHTIGRIFLMAPAHVEGVFVEPAWRGGTLYKRLVDAIEMEARAEGISKVYAYAINGEMEDYIARCNYAKLPWSVLVKEIG